MENLPVKSDGDLLPSKEMWDRIKEIASYAVKSGLLPSSIRTPEAAAVIALKGHELGLKPMVAFSHIYVVNGKPACSAEIMLAEIRRVYPKAHIKITQSTESVCIIKAKRPDEEETTDFKWTIDDAKRAGLLGKDVWKNYPRNMLRWRCISDMKRIMFPEVLMGLDHTPEELESDKEEKTLEEFIQKTSPVKERNIVEEAQIVEAKPESVTQKEEPKPTSHQQPEPAVTKEEKPAEPKIEAPTRDQLGKQIMEALQDAKMKVPDYVQWVKTKFKKAPNELTVVEMKDSLIYLQQTAERNKK